MNVILLTCRIIEKLGSLRDAGANKAKFHKRDEAVCIVPKMHSTDWARMGVSATSMWYTQKQINRRMASSLPRVEKPGGHELVSFRRHEIRSITGPRINYELNATEAAYDRKLSEPETNL